MTAPAVVGFFSFTEVTDPGGHRAYNEWHQLDHLVEQYSVPGIVHGERWVASPDLRALWPAVEAPLDRVHYVTLYLVAEPVGETLEAFWALGEELARQGRFIGGRRSHLSGPFDVVGRTAAARARVSPEVLPFRPGSGVVVVVEDPAREVPGGVGAGLEGLEGVAGVWTFDAREDRSGRWTSGGERITVGYLDDDPAGACLALAGRLGGRRPRLAGAFGTIRPGEWDWFSP